MKIGACNVHFMGGLLMDVDLAPGFLRLHLKVLKLVQFSLPSSKKLPVSHHCCDQIVDRKALLEFLACRAYPLSTAVSIIDRHNKDVYV